MTGLSDLAKLLLPSSPSSQPSPPNGPRTPHNANSYLASPTTMKRSRVQFEADGDHSSTSPAGSTAPPMVRTSEDDVRSNHSNQASQVPHIPKISRKIRACTECKRHKVRCDMKQGENICQRCSKMGLQCVVNKSLQTLLDDEAEWKTMIELAMSDLLKRARLPDLSYYQVGGPAHQQARANGRERKVAAASEDSTVRDDHSGDDQKSSTTRPQPRREQSRYSPEREAPEGASLVTAPMGSLFEVTQLSHSRSSSPTRQYAPDHVVASDFISRGVVDLAEAEELFRYFDQRLNHYLWDGTAMLHKDLISVRRSSTLLTAAILAVSALHIPNKERTFDTCYAEFARLASESMLDRHHTFDDLRALCIGAFWLSNVSWKLSGYAVRIATERNLHQCYRKAIQGSPEHREQARLWYLLYVLEHHYSIAYGRPPIIHEDACITNHNRFVDSPDAEQRDVRLHSQVALFIILTRIYHAFGPDVDLEVLEHELPKIEEFDRDIENWRNIWGARLAGNPYIGNYPNKAVPLHSHFSRLTLNSVALRTYHSATSYRPLSAERKKRAEIAINSAIATLKVVLDEPDIQRGLVGVPLFLHSMITFAAVFLLKIAVKVHPDCSNVPGRQVNSLAAAGLRIDIPYVLGMIDRIVDLMVSASKQASERHVCHHIARGLRKMLDGFREWEQKHLEHTRRAQQRSWLQETSSLYNSVGLSSPRIGGRTMIHHPPAMLGLAPLSSERSNSQDDNEHNHNNGYGPSSTGPDTKAQNGLADDTMDPMMADLWGFEEEYFPTGVFDFLQSQMPA